MALLVLGCALGGGVVGALLPEWLHRLPEPAVPGEDKTPYAELARAPIARPLFAVATAGCFALVAWRVGASGALPAELYLTAIGVLLFYIDAKVRLLPNAIVLPSYLVVLVLLAGGAAVSRQWSALLWAVGCGAVLWLLFAIAAFAYPAGVGFGDVKLLGLLGMGLGWFGAAYALVGLFLAFILGGVISLALIILRRASRKSHLPFGPFLILGYLISLLFAEDLVGWYLGGS